MKPPRIWAMETRNGFILEGKFPEPWRHRYPTSHSPATYLTHKLTSFKAIEIDMGLGENLDTVPASVDENDETLSNFYTSLGPALPIATLQWKIIIYKIIKISIIMYGRKLLRAIPHFTHFHWFSPFRIAIHRRIVQFFSATHSTDRSSRRIIGCFHCDLGHGRGWEIPKLNGGSLGKSSNFVIFQPCLISIQIQIMSGHWVITAGSPFSAEALLAIPFLFMATTS